MKDREDLLNRLCYFIALIILLLFFALNLCLHCDMKKTALELLGTNLTKSIIAAEQIASRNCLSSTMWKLKSALNNVAVLANNVYGDMQSAFFWEAVSPFLTILSIACKLECKDCTHRKTVLFWLVFGLTEGTLIYNAVSDISILNHYRDLKNNIETIWEAIDFEKFIRSFP